MYGEVTLDFQFCLPFRKGSTIKGQTLLFGSKFFSVRVDAFEEGLLPREETESYNSSSIL